MVPIDLPVVNLILRAPEGRPDIGDLKAFSVPEDNLVLTAWRPTAAELDALVLGGPVWLGVACSRNSFPPVWLGAGPNPLKEQMDYAARLFAANDAIRRPR